MIAGESDVEGTNAKCRASLILSNREVSETTHGGTNMLPNNIPALAPATVTLNGFASNAGNRRTTGVARYLEGRNNGPTADAIDQLLLLRLYHPARPTVHETTVISQCAAGEDTHCGRAEEEEMRERAGPDENYQLEA